MRSWAAAAAELRRFVNADQGRHDDRYLIVRYEDLVKDHRTSLAAIFRFLELDDAVFDFEAAARLPVRGSSAYFGPGHDSVHWEPVPRGADFDPTDRWRSWSRAQLQRFEWIAGDELRYLGYRCAAEPIRPPYGIVLHRIRDWVWNSRVAVRRLRFHARGRIGSATRPLRERLGLA